MMVEVKEERKIHRIGERLGISSDNSKNILLFEWYETSIGTGKSAPKSGEFAWRPFPAGANYSTIDSLGYGLLRHDVVEAIGEVGLDIEPFKEYIDAKLEEYKSFLTEHITLELAKVKGKVVDEENN